MTGIPAARGPGSSPPEELAVGVPLELAERVVVLLHWADPASRDAVDALGMVGTSVGLQHVRRHIEQVADLNVPVLIRGETGSGKELIARAIHQRGPRRDKAFVSVNLGAIPKELAPSELFGVTQGRLHRRGEGPGGLLPGGPRRHALPGRGGRGAARGAGRCCCGCWRRERSTPWASAPR